MERSEALRRVPFLRSLPEAAIDAIAAASEERILSKGDVLFREREPCAGLLVVREGSIKLSKIDQRGRELVLGLERPGGSVAELPLFDGGNYPAYAEANEEGTIVIVVPRERFLAAMEQFPEIATHAVRALAVRMRKMLQMLEEQALHTVQVRLANYLLLAAGHSTEFTIAETNEVIAGHLGTVREVVSRTLGSFRDSGMIDLRGRRVTIVDLRKLRRAAEAED